GAEPGDRVQPVHRPRPRHGHDDEPPARGREGRLPDPLPVRPARGARRGRRPAAGPRLAPAEGLAGRVGGGRDQVRRAGADAARALAEADAKARRAFYEHVASLRVELPDEAEAGPDAEAAAGLRT